MLEGNKKIKVLRIITRLNIGGPAKHAAFLSSGLQAKGHESHLIFGSIGRNEGDMSDLCRDEGIITYDIKSLRREVSVFGDLLAFFKILKIILKIKPDVVHTHLAKVGFLGRLAAAIARVPVIIHTYHGHVFSGYFHPVKAKLYIYLDRFVNFFTTRTIAISQKIYDDICFKYKVANPVKTKVVHLGLKTKRFEMCEQYRGELRRELGVDDKDLIVGFVGRLIPIKNGGMLIDVANKVLEKEKHVKFLIVGDGEERGYLERLVRKYGIEKSVQFLGWRRDLERIAADSDVIVLTSNNEGTPVSLIEAMFAARPVVTTDAGGVRDVVADRETGYIIELNNTGDFADKLTVLLHNVELREKFGKKAQELAVKKFGLERLVDEIDCLYRELLTKG